MHEPILYLYDFKCTFCIQIRKKKSETNNNIRDSTVNVFSLLIIYLFTRKRPKPEHDAKVLFPSQCIKPYSLITDDSIVVNGPGWLCLHIENNESNSFNIYNIYHHRICNIVCSNE